MGEGTTRGRDIPVIALEGSPRNRGRIHGETLRPRIHELLEIWKGELGQDLGSSPEDYLDDFVAETSFEGAIKRWTPDLLDEVRGLAEGAAVDFNTMYAFQLPDEDWWYRRNRKLGVRLPGGHKCSTLGVVGRGGQPTYVGQNMDLPGFVDGFQVLLGVSDHAADTKAFVFTYAGLIATTGINSHGVALCVNTLIQLDPSLEGLPVAFIIRRLLEQTSFDGAVDFVATVQHASGQNYTIGGPTAVAAFECSANRVVRYSPYEGSRWVCHTNHPMVNDDQSVYRDRVIGSGPREVIERDMQNTTTRLQSMHGRLHRTSEIDLELLKAVLASHDDRDNPVCRHLREDSAAFTCWSVLYQLDERPQAHWVLGPPCSARYRTLAFDQQAG